MKFGLIGNGDISRFHKHAMKEVGGRLWKVHDPFNPPEWGSDELNESFFVTSDVIVICSPSHLHREHVKLALSYYKKIIVEKPMVLPWEPLIDDDRVNIVLQLRWMDLPDEADLVQATFVRGLDYFRTWKGDARKTGGLFYNLFIHYIDLAIRLKARFEGIVLTEGEQIKKVDDIDILNIDMNELYTKMYHDILFNDNGIKPRDLFYLHWVMDQFGSQFGIGKEAVNKRIRFDSTTVEFCFNHNG